jgi:hypothetical protein
MLEKHALGDCSDRCQLENLIVIDREFEICE